MATIKDIAQLAGVSQGTVSNVLNGKGNVSSKKVLLVEEAARRLGYTVNEQAKLLRKGSSRTVALILPNSNDQQYIDVHKSFTTFAETKEYSVELFFTDDNSEREKAVIALIKSLMVLGVASCTSLGEDAASIYQEHGFKSHQVLFVERGGGPNSIGFDNQKAAEDIVAFIKQETVRKVIVVTEEVASPDEIFFRRIADAFDGHMPIQCVRTNGFTRKAKIFNLLGDAHDAIVVCTHVGLAQQCLSIQKSFFPDLNYQLIPIAPLVTLPDQDFQRYELNYRYLGRQAAEQLLDSATTKVVNSVTLKNTGFKTWAKSPMVIRGNPKVLRMLLLASPPSLALQHLARLYSRSTGTSIHVEVAGYEDINQILESEPEAACYDILRVGADVLSWDAPAVLRPLDEIDYDVDGVFNSLIVGLEGPFTNVYGRRYTIPISPSLQILYYRKDLFSKTVLRRLYYEMHREELDVPVDFAQFNRIASFFTKSQHARSPIPYGTTLVLGNTPILAGTEFLTRYFSYADSIFEDGLPLLHTAAAQRAIDDILGLRDCVDPTMRWWADAAQGFANGQHAMTIVFSNFASEFLGSNSLVSDKIGFSMIPGHSPLLGGGSLGISKKCRHPEEALKFISWLASEPIASAVALLGGNPITKDTLTNYEVIETYPWMEMLSTGFTQSLGQRVPSNDNRPFNDHKFLTLLGRAVWSCWFDHSDPRQALEVAFNTYCAEQETYVF